MVLKPLEREGVRLTNIQELIGTGKNQKSLNQVELEKVYKYAAADSLITFKLRNFAVAEGDSSSIRPSGGEWASSRIRPN